MHCGDYSEAPVMLQKSLFLEAEIQMYTVLYDLSSYIVSHLNKSGRDVYTIHITLSNNEIITSDIIIPTKRAIIVVMQLSCVATGCVRNTMYSTM